MRTTATALTILIGLAGPLLPAARAGEPLTIEQAQEMARQKNGTLQLARERLYQAEVLIDKAWVSVQPQISANASYLHMYPSASLNFPDFNSIFGAITTDPNICGSEQVCINPDLVTYSKTDIIKSETLSFQANLTQPLFYARAYTAIKMANTGYDLAQVSTVNLEDYLLHTVEVAYYSALTAKKFVAAARNAVELRREHLKIARAKFEVGDQPKITVLSAQIDLNQSEQDVKTSENSLALAKEALALLLVTSPDFELVEPEPAKRPAETLDTFIDRALAQRRDLEVARLNLDLAERTKQDAWFQYLPSLALIGNFSASNTKGFTGEYYSWNVGLGLSIPLYEGGLRTTALEDADSQIRQAQIQIENTKRNIRTEIRQLWLNMESAEANLKKARQALELAREQADLSKVSFEAGAITNLEVLDANHLVFLSEISVAQLELQLQVAITTLNKAVRMFSPTGSLAASTGGGALGGGAGRGGGSSALSGAAGAAAGSPAGAGGSSMGSTMGGGQRF